VSVVSTQEITGISDAVIILRGLSEAPGETRHMSAEDEKQHEDERERVLLCKTCSAEITKSKQRISRAGKHLHTFFNPAGIVYEIGCFKRAPGCLPHGQISSDFSWFGGYSWQIVFCGVCHDHLGWFYDSGEDSFFGLITNRLKEG